MERITKKYNLEKFKEQYSELSDSEVEIYFDVTNEKDFKEIIEFLASEKKKFENILFIILKEEYINTLYKREGKTVSTMKFRDNKRIYCKECFKNGKKVVMISYFHKKVQKNQDSEQLTNLIKKIESYEYRFE